MPRPQIIAIAAIALGTLLTGCAKPPARQAPSIYTGPTDPLDVVLARINENNARISTLAGTGTFLATLVDENRKSTTLNGQVTLLHAKPDKLWLRLNKDIAGDVVRLGTNGERFWLSVFGEVDTTWYGTPRGPGQEVASLPISPELIADVLGVATLSIDLLAQPVPTMRFNPDYDAYMLTWHTPLKDRWITLREVWYDRQTLQPRLAWLFDRNGRMVLRAKLSDFQPMDDEASAPRVARSFDLLFPQNGSRLAFQFDQLRARRGGAPNNLTFRFDPARTGTARVENLDDGR